MVAFFVKNGGYSQNLSGTVGDTKAAAFASIFNNNDLSQLFFPRTVFILWIYLIFLSFLHLFNTFPYIIELTQDDLPDGFICLIIGDFRRNGFP